MSQKQELDSIYFLKLVLYFVLGALWVQFTYDQTPIPLPFGLLLGLYFAHHDHFRIDRKIEFAILLASSILSFVFPIGFVLII
jgi:ABC-type dipeptide/oligopeptide/nickel transport system permease component